MHPVSLPYSGLVRFATAESTFFLSVFQNLPGGPHGRAEDFDGPPGNASSSTASRVGSRPNYTLLRYGANVNKAFASDWQMRVGINGQYTGNALISGEQFGLGGADNVRGFLEREVSNDRGVRATAELYTPDFGNKFGSQWRIRGLAFYDEGWAERNHALDSELKAVKIAGTGVGLRAARGNNLTIRADYAYVTEPGGTENKNHEKLHFSLVYVF